jgi:hypothetical protein
MVVREPIADVTAVAHELGEGAELLIGNADFLLKILAKGSIVVH